MDWLDVVGIVTVCLCVAFGLELLGRHYERRSMEKLFDGLKKQRGRGHGGNH